VLFLLQAVSLRGIIWCSTAGLQALPQDYDAQTAAAKLDLLWKTSQTPGAAACRSCPWVCITRLILYDVTTNKVPWLSGALA
jgi:hypothetical protein